MPEVYNYRSIPFLAGGAGGVGTSPPVPFSWGRWGHVPSGRGGHVLLGRGFMCPRGGGGGHVPSGRGGHVPLGSMTY